ncbi:MAG: M20/M25/M40 family metallo-hydrolase [Phenylobacterium sp.]|nr:MAG: M20/M25/M40 family metallo-hydrolase [Phenylobacterium sp.]
MGRLLALVAALIAAAAIAWTVQQAPKPLPATAAATAFSAERAMADIKAFAAVPHPISTAANHASRDYLLGRMTALGLAPQMRRGVGFEAPRFAPNVLVGGNVEDLVGVLPGRDRAAPAVALMAHYDSVPGSSGAADDGAGAASALEIVRALKANGTPARDVMVILTDGEEAGLLGARAFFERDPLARRVGYLFNMEARGDAGRVQMFQTGAAAGGTIALLRRTAVRPQATSLSSYVYERMPNDTDFTVSKAAHVPGMNFAFSGRQFDYHAPSSVPATLDGGTLQDMGQQVLAPARAAAFDPALPAAAPDLVYSQVFGDLILAYPQAVGWLVLLAAAALIGLAVVRARRVEAFPWTDVASGAGAALFAVTSAMAVLHFARRLTGSEFGYLEQRFLLAQVTRWEIAVLLLGLGVLLAAISEIGRGRRKIALLPLAAGLASSAFGGFDAVGLGMGVVAAVIGIAAYGRPVSRAGAWTGALALGLVLAIAAQIAAWPIAFVFAWPVAVGAVAAALTDLSERRPPLSLVILAVLSALTLGWLGGFVHGAFISLDLVELVTITLVGAAAVIWPLAQPAEGAPPERLIGPALIIVGLAVTVAVRVNDPYNARYPRVTEVAYEIDQDAHKAWRASYTSDRAPWTAEVLTADGGRVARKPGLRGRTYDAAPAPYIDLPPAQLTLAKSADGVVLHVVPPLGARVVDLKLKSDTVFALVGADGAPTNLPVKPGDELLVRWSTAQDGFDLTLRPIGPGKLTVSYSATVERWPAQAKPLPPRPKDVMAFDLSDSTVIEGSRSFSW